MLYAAQTKAILWYLDEADKWCAMAAETGITMEAVCRRSDHVHECIANVRRVLLDATIVSIETESMPAPQDAVCQREAV